MKRFLMVAASVAAMTAALASVASAQDSLSPGFDRGRNQAVTERARPEYDPEGVQFRAFILRPELVTEVGVTDNVTAAQNRAESDVIVRVRPSLRGETTWSRHNVSFDVGTEKTMFVDLPKNDEYSPYAQVQGRLDIGRDGALLAGGRVANQSEGRTSPDQPLNAASPVEYDTQEFYVGGRYTFGRVRMSARAQQRELDFQDAATASGVIIDQDNRDRTERDLSLRGEVALSPSTALVAEVGVNHRDYDLAPPRVPASRESYGRSYMVGANFDLSRLARGEVTVGYVEQDYKDPAVQTVDGVALNGRVDWFPTDRTTVSFNGQRTVIDGGFGRASAAFYTEGGVRVDHELRRNVLVSGRVAVAQRDYQGLDRQDDLRRAEIGVTYMLNRRAEVRAGYSFERQSSEGVARDRDFEVNSGFVALALRM
jgi:hypothetical protein